MEKQKWSLKEEDTFAKLKKSNSTAKEMADLYLVLDFKQYYLHG